MEEKEKESPYSPSPGGGSTSVGSSYLAPIPDRDEFGQTMTLSRSPSPIPGGGWASPGLEDDRSGRSTPRKGLGDINGLAGGSGVSWAGAKARSQMVNGYASFSTKNNGFFSRHARTISASLPRFQIGHHRDFSEKEKLGRGRWSPYYQSYLVRLRTFLGSLTRRMKFRGLLILGVILMTILFYATRKWAVGCIFLGY